LKGARQMAQMIVRQKVEDFKKWKKVFDSVYALRKAGGEKSFKIFRNTEEPNEITILFEWNNIQDAVKYSQSPLFKEAEKKAGVLSEPFLYLPEEGVES